MNIEIRIAKIISYLLHPFLVPTYGVLLYFYLVEPHLLGSIPPQAKLILLAITFTFTFLLPVFTVLLLFRAKHISNLEVNTAQERRWPFLITACCYLGAYYTIPDLPDMPGISVLRALILGATFAIILTLLINLYTKISAHMVAIGGLAGAFIAFSYRTQITFDITIFSCLIASGLVGFARLSLRAHTPPQVYLGFLVGALCEAGLFLLLP